MDTKKTNQQLLDQLYAPYKKCMECPLGSLGRSTVVFGEGNPNAQLLLIGEAPGRDEDEQGRPFVGRSGRLLSKTLEAYEIARQDIYITNIVKCRPPNNRKPLPAEATTCKNLLLFNQIKIIKPRIICTLGSFALQELLGQTVQITKIRGIPIKKGDFTIIPTYHPAYILRNPPELKSFVLDIEKVAELLQGN
jgi:DNA polymerase